MWCSTRLLPIIPPRRAQLPLLLVLLHCVSSSSSSPIPVVRITALPSAEPLSDGSALPAAADELNASLAAAIADLYDRFRRKWGATVCRPPSAGHASAITLAGIASRPTGNTHASTSRPADGPVPETCASSLGGAFFRWQRSGGFHTHLSALPAFRYLERRLRAASHQAASAFGSGGSGSGGSGGSGDGLLFAQAGLEMWATVRELDEVHELHDHPGSALSGIYYVRMPPGAGALKLYGAAAVAGGRSHGGNVDMDADAGRNGRDAEVGRENDKGAQGGERIGATSMVIHPSEGETIMFPSWVRHEVLPTSSVVGRRISIAFNVPVR